MTRAVITGIGVVAPSGIGAHEHWRSINAGELKVRRISAFDPSRYAATLAGQVDGFQVTDHVDERQVVQTDRWTWMSLAATQLALDDAAYKPTDYDPYATSVALSAGSKMRIASARPPTAPTGMPPPMILPKAVRSGRTS